MTQRNVERILGRLLTDEAFRDQFIEAPAETVANVATGGWELTATELEALASLDPETLAEAARKVDPRIRKASLHQGTSAAVDLDGKENS